mmetsp:Transcript_19348/g.74299  ORF Transcript_19348/g.74299 Transcript_19348/m.74299 type:complete len:126 (-) Transcript_19348:263-640(-)|eukprot:CAMPEP_0114613158 /NCGR_PEP_ID=MMETSP0168-20121206/4988_1 /TAXON_ID=95228 ORGANISM="Vannella sp., Strain DIVA3 517/6/12" /NCGR_SAMPLE_ID=MMETSP0168 /ASSEMBLY_ACC=CAM_ASM_000044 /LENGTH=125 /DNA_ID=CAMNT_0001824155 /DNA_START=33 /DNA_END=410 /DNA_ORIENTATION=+
MEQDWDPVVINGNAGRGKKKRVPPGAETETVRKYNAGSNRQRAGPNARRLEDDEGPPKVETVKVTLSRRIQQARQAKGWTQKQLAQAINEKPTVVNDYESGRAVPNNQILGKMERALGAKIRGKK